MDDQYKSLIVDHLGLVAGMFEELGIGQVIDDLIPQGQGCRHVSIGQTVKAMVLNGLGFTNQRMYLIPQFFDSKPTGILICEGIEPSHLNDDILGRALDKLYEYGVTELFSLIANNASKKLKLSPKFCHLDSTSFHVDGV